MAADRGNDQSPPRRGTQQGMAVNTLLKIQSQFEEWEERDRSKRRRNRTLLLAALLVTVGVIATATLLPGNDGPGTPAPQESAARVVRNSPPARIAPVRFVTTLAPEPRFASYAEKWKTEIEAAAASQLQQGASPGVHGDLVLTTFILPDGSVSRIEISRSSGHQTLDDTAVRIVRAAAPFDPLPDEIRRDTATLAIVRTFTFEPAAAPNLKRNN